MIIESLKSEWKIKSGSMPTKKLLKDLFANVYFDHFNQKVEMAFPLYDLKSDNRNHLVLGIDSYKGIKIGDCLILPIGKFGKPSNLWHFHQKKFYLEDNQTLFLPVGLLNDFKNNKPIKIVVLNFVELSIGNLKSTFFAGLIPDFVPHGDNDIYPLLDGNTSPACFEIQETIFSKNKRIALFWADGYLQ